MVGEKSLSRWMTVPMRVNAAAAEVVVVGRVTEVLPARRIRAVLDHGFPEDGDWRPVKVDVSEVLLDWAATTKPAAPPGTFGVTVAPGVPVGAAADAKPLAPDPGIAPVELNRASRYLLFLNRVPEVQGYVLLANTACYVADDENIAAARSALRFDRWDWGKPAGPLRACYIPEEKIDVELKPGQSAGLCWAPGWTILRNTGSVAVEVTIGSPGGLLRRGIPATLQATSADGAKAAAVLQGSATVRVPPGRCVHRVSTERATARQDREL